LLKLIESEKIVYLERKDGTISAILVPQEHNAQKIRDEMLNECVEILKKRYQIEYSQQNQNYIYPNANLTHDWHDRLA